MTPKILIKFLKSLGRQVAKRDPVLTVVRSWLAKEEQRKRTLQANRGVVQHARMHFPPQEESKLAVQGGTVSASQAQIQKM